MPPASADSGPPPRPSESSLSSHRYGSATSTPCNTSTSSDAACLLAHGGRSYFEIVCDHHRPHTGNSIHPPSMTNPETEQRRRLRPTAVQSCDGRAERGRDRGTGSATHVGALAMVRLAAAHLGLLLRGLLRHSDSSVRVPSPPQPADTIDQPAPTDATGHTWVGRPHGPPHLTDDLRSAVAGRRGVVLDPVSVRCRAGRQHRCCRSSW